MSYLPFIDQSMTIEQAELLNPLVLAFIGDSVQTLYVRTKVASKSSSKAGQLHRLVSSEINATSQAKALERIISLLTEQEQNIYKRARNSKTNTPAKNASIIDYKKASGFEAVLGFLYLTGQNERLSYILKQGEIL